MENCTEEKKDAAIELTHGNTGDTVFEETVRVPGESCSDVADGIEREDVFSEGGLYTVAVSVGGYDPTEEQVEITEQEIEDNEDSVTITIREDEIVIA